MPYIAGLGAAATLAGDGCAAASSCRCSGCATASTPRCGPPSPAWRSTAIPRDRLAEHAERQLPRLDGARLLARTPTIAAATGSACHSGHTEPSAVLTAIGLDADRALGAVRLSLGYDTTAAEIDAAAAALARRGRRRRGPRVSGAARAEAYDRHTGRYGPELSAAFVRFAGVEPGMRVLDVGCGPGALTARLAQIVGARPCAGRRSVARRTRRPAGSACPAPRCASAPPRRCRSTTAAFDAVLAQLVIQALDDAPAAAREMRRVAAPGGSSRRACGTSAAGCRCWMPTGRRSGALDPDGAVAAGDDSADPWCTRDGLRRLWEGAGIARRRDRRARGRRRLRRLRRRLVLVRGGRRSQRRATAARSTTAPRGAARGVPPPPRRPRTAPSGSRLAHGPVRGHG